MHNNKWAERGVITVLVAGMLLGMLSLGTLVLEMGRYTAGKTQLSAAADSAASSMIASFDPALYERYGLLSIDKDKFTAERVIEYLKFNSDLSAGYQSNKISTLYSLEGVEFSGLYNLTYPALLKRQLLSQAKYRIVPENNTINLYNIRQILDELADKCNSVENEMLRIQNRGNNPQPGGDSTVQMALAALLKTFCPEGSSVQVNKAFDVVLSNASVALLPGTTGTVESFDTTADQEKIANTVLDAIDEIGENITAYDAYTAYEETDVSNNDFENLRGFSAYVDKYHNGTIQVGQNDGTFSAPKALAQKVSQITAGIRAGIATLTPGWEENLLLNTYLSNFFSNRTRRAVSYMGPLETQDFAAGADNLTFYSACTEYLLGGSADEQENQKAAMQVMMSIRMIYNLYLIMNQSSYQPENPWSVSTHLTWAYYETVADLWLQSLYDISVPLNKERPIIPMNDPSKVVAAFASGDFAEGMNKLGWYNGTTFEIPGEKFYYTDSLALSLWFVPNSVKLLRTADLIQLEMRYKEQHLDGGVASFLMSEQNTYCRISVTAKLKSMLPIIPLGGTDSIDSIPFQTIRYAGY